MQRRLVTTAGEGGECPSTELNGLQGLDRPCLVSQDRGEGGGGAVPRSSNFLLKGSFRRLCVGRDKDSSVRSSGLRPCLTVYEESPGFTEGKTHVSRRDNRWLRLS